MPTISTDELRARFARAMSAMYKKEVPAYGTLLQLVHTINNTHAHHLPPADAHRLSEERHGAIRLGTPQELKLIRRAFALMGMHPVGYYDLTVAGIPVHSTAFRPIEETALRYNPFRVFTSLIRLDAITDKPLQQFARHTLARRQIFSDNALRLIQQAEQQDSISDTFASQFITAILDTFRWHSQAIIDKHSYNKLNATHRLLADVISFRGPHINHLTPRTLDIDAAQQAMRQAGLNAKAIIEGPPRRHCPILLRQTSFLALQEHIKFYSVDANGNKTWEDGKHTARFGEIEQRGAALTRLGRQQYDTLLQQTRQAVPLSPDGHNAAAYQSALTENFAQFPDNWVTLREQQLAYFRYFVKDKQQLHNIANANPAPDIDTLVAQGAVGYEPITYEDFLPVSAAGIFQSNLGDDAQQQNISSSHQSEFEDNLGTSVLDQFTLYATLQTTSLTHCLNP